MPFPTNDHYWSETADFVKAHYKSGDTMVAPAEFVDLFPDSVIPYSAILNKRARFQWVLVHKGALNQIQQSIYSRVASRFAAVFANEVFVVFSSRVGSLSELDPEFPHLKSLGGGVRTDMSIIQDIRTRIVSAGWKNRKKIRRIPFLGKIAADSYRRMVLGQAFSGVGIERNTLESSGVQQAIDVSERARSLGPPLREQLPSRREMVYTGDYRALTRLIWGQKMYVDTRDLTLAPHILLDGFWELWITNVFLSAVKEGMTVVEVGSNIGYYSILAASRIGPEGRLYAFEANPKVFKILQHNMSVNGFLDRVTLSNAAVLDKTGTVKFYLRDFYMGNSSVAPPTEASLNINMDSTEPTDAPCVSLDEYFGQGLFLKPYWGMPGMHNQWRDYDDSQLARRISASADVDFMSKAKVDVVKIDAEGSEPFIIRGMRGVLDRNPDITIICEFSPDQIKGVGVEPREFLTELRNSGFILRTIDNPDSRLIGVSVDDLLSRGYGELFLRRT